MNSQGIGRKMIWLQYIPGVEKRWEVVWDQITECPTDICDWYQTMCPNHIWVTYVSFLQLLRLQTLDFYLIPPFSSMLYLILQ